VFVEVNHFHQHGFLAVMEILARQRQGLTPDKEAYEKHISDLSGKLDVYDQILSKQKYLVGNELTLVDLYHLPIGLLIGRLGINVMESKPNVARWFKEISSRDSWVSFSAYACRLFQDINLADSSISTQEEIKN